MVDCTISLSLLFLSKNCNIIFPMPKPSLYISNNYKSNSFDDRYNPKVLTMTSIWGEFDVELVRRWWIWGGGWHGWYRWWWSFTLVMWGGFCWLQVLGVGTSGDRLEAEMMEDSRWKRWWWLCEFDVKLVVVVVSIYL